MIEESAAEVLELPEAKPDDAVTERARNIQEALEKKKAEKEAKEAQAEEKRQEKIGAHLNAVTEYLAETDVNRRAELFDAYVNGRLAEIRHDQTNLLTPEEATNRFESAYQRIEKDILLALALTERQNPETAKANRNALKAIVPQILKFANLSLNLDAQ